MKTLRTTLVTALVMASALVSSAIEIGINSSYYIGNVINGAPANPQAEVAYINILIDMPLGSSLDPFEFPNSTGEFFNRSTNVFGTSPDAVVDGALKFENPDASFQFNLTGWEYMMVKTGGASYAFDISPLSGFHSLDLPFPSGISHISLYNPGGQDEPPDDDPPPSVPDGGTTLAMLGAALMGLGFIQRKLRN